MQIHFDKRKSFMLDVNYNNRLNEQLKYLASFEGDILRHRKYRFPYLEHHFPIFIPLDIGMQFLFEFDMHVIFVDTFEFYLHNPIIQISFTNVDTFNLAIRYEQLVFLTPIKISNLGKSFEDRITCLIFNIL